MSLSDELWREHWFARLGGPNAIRVTDWHYCDSTIEDRAVTPCGRQLKRETNDGILALAYAEDEAPAADRCTLCSDTLRDRAATPDE